MCASGRTGKVTGAFTFAPETVLVQLLLLGGVPDRAPRLRVASRVCPPFQPARSVAFWFQAVAQDVAHSWR